MVQSNLEYVVSYEYRMDIWLSGSEHSGFVNFVKIKCDEMLWNQEDNSRPDNSLNLWQFEGWTWK